MIAIPLAYVNPRLGRYTPLVFAVLIYLTYSNLINLAQAWVRSGSMSFWMAIWPIHLIVFLCALVLFRYRANRSLGGWRAVFGLRRAAGGRAMLSVYERIRAPDLRVFASSCSRCWRCSCSSTCSANWKACRATTHRWWRSSTSCCRRRRASMRCCRSRC
jgi:hypothetical protein